MWGKSYSKAGVSYLFLSAMENIGDRLRTTGRRYRNWSACGAQEPISSRLRGRRFGGLITTADFKTTSVQNSHVLLIMSAWSFLGCAAIVQRKECKSRMPTLHKLARLITDV